MPDISAILANPSVFGLQFITETVKRDKVSSGPVPLIKVTDLTEFDAAFPGVILETEDGQSIRVNSQRVVRDAWFDARDRDMKSLQTRLVRWLLKIEQPTMAYLAADGKRYATEEDAVKASQEWALSQ